MALFVYLSTTSAAPNPSDGADSRVLRRQSAGLSEYIGPVLTGLQFYGFNKSAEAHGEKGVLLFVFEFATALLKQRGTERVRERENVCFLTSRPDPRPIPAGFVGFGGSSCGLDTREQDQGEYIKSDQCKRHPAVMTYVKTN